MCSIFAEGKQHYLLFLRRRRNLIFAYYPIDLIRGDGYFLRNIKLTHPVNEHITLETERSYAIFLFWFNSFMGLPQNHPYIEKIVCAFETTESVVETHTTTNFKSSSDFFTNFCYRECNFLSHF